MTQKARIEPVFEEICRFLEIDKEILRKAAQEGIKRLAEPKNDNRLEAYMRSKPQKEEV